MAGEKSLRATRSLMGFGIGPRNQGGRKGLKRGGNGLDGTPSGRRKGGGRQAWPYNEVSRVYDIEAL